MVEKCLEKHMEIPLDETSKLLFYVRNLILRILCVSCERDSCDTLDIFCAITLYTARPEMII